MKINPIPGDEPVKYFDSQTSKQESVQQRFYSRGLHKKNGRYSRAIDHLLQEYPESSGKIRRKGNSIDLSKVDTWRHVLPPVPTSMPEKKQAPSANKDILIPPEIQQSVQSVSNIPNFIDNNPSLDTVINCINTQDNFLGDLDYGNTNIDYLHYL